MPAVSVVIPLFDKGYHVTRAMQSVLSQTCPDFELIVIDDGSTDDGARVVGTIQDPRIRLIRQANAGVSAARNRGIAEAHSELIAFLDADDEWLPGFLATVLRLTQRHPECGAYATAYMVVESGGRSRTLTFDGIPAPPWRGVIPNYFRSAPSYPITASSVAVRRSAFAVVGQFPVGVALGEDLDTWCRVALRYPIAFSSCAGAIIHKEAENRCGARRPVPHWQESRLLETIGRALKSDALPPGVSRSDLVEYRNKKLLEVVHLALETGDTVTARKHAVRAAATRRYRRRWLRDSFRAFFPAFARRFASGPPCSAQEDKGAGH